MRCSLSTLPPTRTALCARLLCLAVVAGLSGGLARPAEAQDAGAALEHAGSQEFGGKAGADLGIGKLGEDFFLTVYLATTFAYDKLGVGIQVPLRLRVVDEDPQDDGLIRDEDWDEISDYLRVIRFVQWSQPGDTVYARVGELGGATVGHGTLMNNYLNVVDVDHFQLGLDSELNLAFGGLELVLDNFAAPEIFGARLYARPWSFVDAESFLARWAVGTSLVADVGAPLLVKRDEAGEARVDDANNLLFDESAIVMWGLDTDFALLDTELARITPYLDNNFIFAQTVGYGFHAGVLGELFLPSNSGLSLRLEYQYLGSDYAAQYIDSVYEVQRDAFPAPQRLPDGSMPTKQAALDEENEGSHGFLAQFEANILGAITFVGQYRGSLRAYDNDLLLQLLLPKVDRVQLGVLYAKSHFASFGDIVDPDGALFSAYARVNVVAFLDLIASFNRRWQLVSDRSDEDFGSYETIDEWNAGVGVSVAF